MTVILHVPAFNAFTLPSLSTEAIVASLLLQLTFLLSASAGLTVAFKANDSPTANVFAVASSDTPVTSVTSGSSGSVGVEGSDFLVKVTFTSTLPVSPIVYVVRAEPSICTDAS